MTKHYEQRKASNERYLAKLDEVKLRAPAGAKDAWKAHAQRVGESLNQYILTAIERRMKEDERQ